MATSPRRAVSPSYHAQSEEKITIPFDTPNNASPPPPKGAMEPCILSDSGVFPARLSTNSEEGSSGRAATPDDILIALAFGLDLVRHGAILVALQGRPHLANRAALQILQKRDGISIARGGIVADRAADTCVLHKLLRDAITSPESGEPQ